MPPARTFHAYLLPWYALYICTFVLVVRYSFICRWMNSARLYLPCMRLIAVRSAAILRFSSQVICINHYATVFLPYASLTPFFFAFVFPTYYAAPLATPVYTCRSNLYRSSFCISFIAFYICSPTTTIFFTLPYTCGSSITGSVLLPFCTFTYLPDSYFLKIRYVQFVSTPLHTYRLWMRLEKSIRRQQVVGPSRNTPTYPLFSFLLPLPPPHACHIHALLSH